MNVIGINVCNGGWLGVKLSNSCWSIRIFKTIDELIDVWKDSDLFFVSIPMGFLEGSVEERKCDIEARKLLDSSHLDLPAVPCREAIYCNSFGVANIVNKRLTGRNVSTRLWDVIEKIRELDNFLLNHIEYRDKFKESNCEIGFFVLSGRFMRNSKTVLAGYKERRDVLRKVYPNVDEILDYSIKTFRRKDVKTENVLDAVCLAINGMIGLKNGFIPMPEEPEYDINNIKMQIEIPKSIEYSYGKDVI
ncbi:DUF429 domain-containing protein [Clostridium sp. UBA4548]|uniref:DUF429 domain-containing protein n=1 Tax=Clostridium sp. UBA4548 TaxID=1946361 RepID=UPI0025C0EF03|nr:DUF429 domain-containing protein [Clostridium sp. UBA4548]